tara:strand:+ start:1367 stop:1483 length:117 start_codon:yes stop_codon:yes gene_type:complete
MRKLQFINDDATQYGAQKRQDGIDEESRTHLSPVFKEI